MSGVPFRDLQKLHPTLIPRTMVRCDRPGHHPTDTPSM